MAVDDGGAAEQRPDYPQEALISAAEEKIGAGAEPGADFVGAAIDSPVLMSSIAQNRPGSEHLGLQNFCLAAGMDFLQQLSLFDQSFFFGLAIFLIAGLEPELGISQLGKADLPGSGDIFATLEISRQAEYLAVEIRIPGGGSGDGNSSHQN